MKFSVLVTNRDCSMKAARPEEFHVHIRRADRYAPPFQNRSQRRSKLNPRAPNHLFEGQRLATCNVVLPYPRAVPPGLKRGGRRIQAARYRVHELENQIERLSNDLMWKYLDNLRIITIAPFCQSFFERSAYISRNYVRSLTKPRRTVCQSLSWSH